MNRPRLFAEFPAGLAAVSLRLQGGAHCRPPISRMGNKAGYAHTILDALGLHSGQGAGAYWWAEADPDVAALLRIYPDPDALREVARIIRGWSGEEPRALWERLRAERRARGAARGTVGEVAAWLQEVARTDNIGKFATNQDNRERGGWRGNGPPPDGLADRADRLAEVAGWVAEAALSAKGMPDAGYNGEHERFLRGERFAGPDLNNQADCADRLANSAISAPVRVSPRIPTAAEVATAIGTPGDLEGCVVYADPPYAGTTGYAHDLPRAEVVRYCLAYADMGATVCVSEQEPIPELMQAGWYATEITADRVGQRRTFSKQKAEWLTMSVAPKRCQIGLFNLGEVLHA